jgi:uncharacterized damage-inducible protein DinB
LSALLLNSTDSAEAGVAPLVAVLHQLAELLGAVSDEQYVMKPAAVVKSSIGGHVRHCLDHVDTLLQGARIGAMNYDDRQRGTDVETNRHAALREMERQTQELIELRDFPLDHTIRLRTLLVVDQPSLVVETSLGRELAFVLSHTIHHNALVGVIARLAGVSVPERFGYAPSTLAHRDKRICAR